MKNEIEEVTAKLGAMNANSAGAASGNLFIASAGEALEALDAARKFEQDKVQARADAESNDQAARDVLNEERQKLGKLTAERDALANMLSRAGQGDYKTVLGDIKVKEGYETALAAALGDDLDGSLEDGAPLQWTGSKIPDQALPHGITALSELVTAPTPLTARLTQIGVINGDPSAHRSQLKTGQILVSKEGHVLRWDGFEIRPEAETAAAKRLQQQNRLDALRGDISGCLLYTSPSPRDRTRSRMPSSA